MATNTLFLSLKVVLICIGAVSIAMVVKASVPLVLYELPIIWTALIAWLKPPYLYVIINGIIIVIAATSRSHHKESSGGSGGGDQLQPLITASTPPAADLVAAISQPVEIHAVTLRSELEVFNEMHVPVKESEPEEEVVLEVEAVVVNGTSVVVDVNRDDEVVNDVRDEVVISKSVNVNSTLPENELEVLLTEKPLVTSRFGHRKPLAKMSPEGLRALRVARPKKQETLDNTWKMITEGRHVPLTRHMKKSDTMDNHHHGRHVTVMDALEEIENTTLAPSHHHHQRHVIKSETFKDRTNYDSSPSPSLVNIRKDPSLSQDDLNRRVEAFIKKFNEEMRLQRQESIQQYMEMINRGV